MKPLLGLGVLVGALIGAVPWASGAEREKLAVLALRVDAPLGEGLVNTLNEVLLEEFHRSGRYEVVGSNDIAALLQFEEQKRLYQECTDDSCLAEVGGALGVRLVASARLGVVGDNYVLNLKVLDATRATVLARSGETMAREESLLLKAMRDVVAQVVGEIEQRESEAREAAAPGLPPANSFRKIVRWTTFSLALAAAGTGAVLAGLALSDAEEARKYVPGAEHDAAAARAENKALAADILFGVAAASAVTSLVFFLIGDPHVAVAPHPGGAGVSFSTRF